MIAADDRIGVKGQPLGHIPDRARAMFGRTVINGWVDKDKMGTRMRMAWRSLCAQTDKRQHKRV